jgi:hypothetical protein
VKDLLDGVLSVSRIDCPDAGRWQLGAGKLRVAAVLMERAVITAGLQRAVDAHRPMVVARKNR